MTNENIGLGRALEDSIRRAGGTDRDIERFANLKPGTVWSEIGPFVLELLRKLADISYSFLVDYACPIKGVIAGGRYNYVRREITDENFPPDRSECGEKTVECRLFHPGLIIGSHEVTQEMRREGCRPATVRELLAFRKANPGFRGQFPIVALGSIWVSPEGYRYVVGLWSGSDGCHLGMYCFGNTWHSNFRFLAISEEDV